MAYHTVGHNESIPSIARDYGFFWETIWEHGNNSELKSARQNPNIMHAGDEVFIPDIALREESRPTDEKHRFRRKGIPIKIKLRLLKCGKPRASEGYVLEVGGKQIEGKTDGDGVLEEFVPPEAHEARLILGADQYKIQIGTLNPIDEVSGVQQRLNNLGYDCGKEYGRIGEMTRLALKGFQANNKLEVTGEIDDATKKKLNEVHQ